MNVRYDMLGKYLANNIVLMDNEYKGYKYIIADRISIMCFKDEDLENNNIKFDYSKIQLVHNIERMCQELSSQAVELKFIEYRNHPSIDNKQLIILSNGKEEIWIDKSFLTRFYTGICKKSEIFKDINFTGLHKNTPVIV